MINFIYNPQRMGSRTTGATFSCDSVSLSVRQRAVEEKVAENSKEMLMLYGHPASAEYERALK